MQGWHVILKSWTHGLYHDGATIERCQKGRLRARKLLLRLSSIYETLITTLSSLLRKEG
jgi:hypothetical protein